jgi:pyruvate,water dikinase
VTELYWLDRITTSQRLQVGDLAMVLSQLTQKGYPVLPGFAIDSSVVKDFFASVTESFIVDLPASSLHLDVDNYRILQQVAQQSRQAIIDAPLPSSWLEEVYAQAQKLNTSALILRPSAIAPELEFSDYASLLRSQACWLSAASLAAALKLVWAQLFTARSLFYTKKAGIDLQQIELAVLVQPLRNAVASGRAIITDRVVKVQATCGLDDSLILGEVLPDEYQIQLATGTVERQSIGIKTRAYRLREQSSISDYQEDCVETYLLSEQEQESSALDLVYLPQLIGLLQKIATETSSAKTLRWTLSQPDISQSQAEFYLTEYTTNNHYKTVTASAHNSSTNSIADRTQTLLHGLAASSGVAIATALTLQVSEIEPDRIPEGVVLVAKNITLAGLPLLKKVAGLIIEQAGITSHEAILAREMKIPAVVGLKDATQAITTGETVLVNGNTGEVYLVTGSREQGVGSREQGAGSRGAGSRGAEEQRGREAGKLILDDYLSQANNYEIATQLMVNLSQPSSIAEASALSIDGVGLLRSELMLVNLLSAQPLEQWLTDSQKADLLERWTEAIAQFAAAFAPRPIFYRSLDGYAAYLSNGNSLQLRRGSYNYLLDPSLFELELEALLKVQQQGYKNLKLILPFVRSIEEFSFCRRQIERIGLTKQSSFQVWIMAEVPSVIFLLPEYIKAGVQGMAIGTNDLTQLLLGIDRDQTNSNTPFNPTHPAMLVALKQLIDTAKQQKIPCSICGRATVDYPELIDYLVTWGITAISTELEAIEPTYRAIARAEKRLLLELARAKHRS